MHTGNPGEFMYYPFVRKALFQLDPEREALVRQKVPT
ncbi:hypothetical protein LTSEURB_1542, partial [Salmonella enterica subsp. enterica serovar Urbana str. R8-2977]